VPKTSDDPTRREIRSTINSLKVAGTCLQKTRDELADVQLELAERRTTLLRVYRDLMSGRPTIDLAENEEKEEKQIAVFICGAPSTGNHVWRDIFRHHQAVHFGIFHYGYGIENHLTKARENGWDVVVLIPTRERWIAIKSMQERHKGLMENESYKLTSWDEAYDAHYAATARFVATEFDIPVRVRFVSYERAMNEPGYPQEVVEWAGFEWRGLSVPLVDRNPSYSKEED